MNPSLLIEIDKERRGIFNKSQHGSNLKNKVQITKNENESDIPRIHIG